MNINQKAIRKLEENKYEKALELFHQAVTESRDVQSLNNLAWMYLYEEEEYDKALEYIQEAVKMNPKHHFPYNILGEVYIKQERWKEAKEALEKAISIQPLKEAYENLAGLNVHLDDLEQAAKYYLKAAGDSDLPMYCHVKCLIYLGKIKEAKEKLDLFNEEAESFVGEIEMADLYVQLGEYKNAIEWFKKGYDGYAKTVEWTSRFVYALFQTKNMDQVYDVIKDVIEVIDEDIENIMQEEVDEYWTEENKKEYIEKLVKDRNDVRYLVERISSGFVPPLQFEPYFTGTCYLFGCQRHGHSEYHIKGK